MPERPQLPEPLDLHQIRSKAMEEVIIEERNDGAQIDFETILAMSPEKIVKDGENMKPAKDQEQEDQKLDFANMSVK